MIELLKFQFAIAYNNYFLTALVIVLGIASFDSTMVEFSLAQGFAIFLFQGLSANFRSRILSEGFQNLELFYGFRFYVGCIVFLVFLLCWMVSEVSLVFSAILARKYFDWLSEVVITGAESKNVNIGLTVFNLMNIITGICLGLSFFFAEQYVNHALLIWAFSPVLFLIFNPIKPVLRRSDHSIIKGDGLSSLTLVSVILFQRVFIEHYFSTGEAADLFTAFALAGAVPSFLLNVFGPSFAHRALPLIRGKHMTVLYVLVGFVAFVSFLIIIFTQNFMTHNSHSLLELALIVSLAGSLMMAAANILKIFMLQASKREVYLQEIAIAFLFLLFCFYVSLDPVVAVIKYAFAFAGLSNFIVYTFSVWKILKWKM